ncbi:MAG TPA: hypothetical protein ENJ35_03685 [Gammaproteobacteria bacterium]|nr:hypothetical protein [Gammaproteobacteria bacterium]
MFKNPSTLHMLVEGILLVNAAVVVLILANAIYIGLPGAMVPPIPGGWVITAFNYMSIGSALVTGVYALVSVLFSDRGDFFDYTPARWVAAFQACVGGAVALSLAFSFPELNMKAATLLLYGGFTFAAAMYWVSMELATSD